MPRPPPGYEAGAGGACVRRVCACGCVACTDPGGRELLTGWTCGCGLASVQGVGGAMGLGASGGTWPCRRGGTCTYGGCRRGWGCARAAATGTELARGARVVRREFWAHARERERESRLQRERARASEPNRAAQRTGAGTAVYAVSLRASTFYGSLSTLHITVIGAELSISTHYSVQTQRGGRERPTTTPSCISL